MKTHEKYLTEIGTGGGSPGEPGKYETYGPAMISRGKKPSKPYPKPDTKGVTKAFTSELEKLIKKALNEWIGKGKFTKMSTGDVANVLHTAIKNIDTKKIF